MDQLLAFTKPFELFSGVDFVQSVYGHTFEDSFAAVGAEITIRS